LADTTAMAQATPNLLGNIDMQSHWGEKREERE